jgi:hypothetical protein
MGGMTVSSPEGEMMICRMAVIVSGFTLVLDLNLGPAEGAIQQGNCCLDPGALGLASCRDLVERANGVHAQLGPAGSPQSPSGKFRFLINTFRRGAGA